MKCSLENVPVFFSPAEPAAPATRTAMYKIRNINCLNVKNSVLHNYTSLCGCYIFKEPEGHAEYRKDLVLKTKTR